MKTFRFVGSESLIGVVKMSRFGQRFSIDDKLALEAQKGGTAILEEPVFNSFGFTPDELKIWADPFMSYFDIPGDPGDAKAKAEFLRKREAAQAKYREIRQGLLAPADRHLTENGTKVDLPLVVELDAPGAPSPVPFPVAVKIDQKGGE